MMETSRQPSRKSHVFATPIQMIRTMQRSTPAGRSTLILTSGIISALLSAALFCLAYLVL